MGGNYLPTGNTTFKLDNCHNEGKVNSTGRTVGGVVGGFDSWNEASKNLPAVKKSVSGGAWIYKKR